MKKVIKEKADALVRVAERAKVALARQGAAFQEEAREEVKILEQVVEVIFPALPAIVNGIEGVSPPRRGVVIPNTGGIWILEDGRFANESLEPLTPAGVTDHVDPYDVIAGLAELFEKQVTGRGAATRGVEIRIRKLRAILALLED